MPINFLGWSEKVLEWQRHSEVGLEFNLNFVEWLIFEQRGKIEFLAGQEIQVIFQHLCYKYKHKVSTFHQEILFGNHCTCYLEYLCFCVSCILSFLAEEKLLLLFAKMLILRLIYTGLHLLRNPCIFIIFGHFACGKQS